jgi:hypothetical protein
MPQGCTGARFQERFSGKYPLAPYANKDHYGYLGLSALGWAGFIVMWLLQAVVFWKAFALVTVVTISLTVPVFGEMITDPVDVVGRLDSVTAVLLGALTFVVATIGFLAFYRRRPGRFVLFRPCQKQRVGGCSRTDDLT